MKIRLCKLLKSLVPAALFAIALFFPFVVTSRGQTKESETRQTEIQAEIVASGGAFSLEKTVTAGGGNPKQFSSISENGTTGQAIAGIRSTGGNFSLYPGFWTPDNFAPTAASAVVGGRILTASGAGIRNVRITIAFPSGELRTTVSSAFGYYRFAGIPVGGTYVVSVAAKKYAFSQPVQIRQVQDDLQDVDFIADETIPAPPEIRPE